MYRYICLVPASFPSQCRVLNCSNSTLYCYLFRSFKNSGHTVELEVDLHLLYLLYVVVDSFQVELSKSTKYDVPLQACTSIKNTYLLENSACCKLFTGDHSYYR